MAEPSRTEAASGTTQRQKAAHFLALHRGPAPLLMPNPWDIGSAVLLTSLGFRALATTSSGFAASRGRWDGSVSRDEALAHARTLAEATALPLSADLENGFAADPAAVAATVAAAVGCGLAGCSIEDASGDGADPVYPTALAVERVRAAAAAAHDGDVRLVLTARAENHLYGRDDLADTIDRLQRYQDAGADVLFAPGLATVQDIGALVDSVDAPVNVLVRPGSPPVAALAALGVARISVGGAFAFAALGTLVSAARELLDDGTYGWTAAAAGREAAGAAFGPQGAR